MMEFTCQDSMRLPAVYAVLSEDEMVYIEGGALALNITPEQVAQFSTNVVVNLIRLLGQGAISYATSSIQNAHNDGLSTMGALRHYWGRQNTFGKAMTVVVVGFAGVYVYYQVVSLINSFLSIYNDMKSIYNGTSTPQTDTAASGSVTDAANAALAA